MDKKFRSEHQNRRLIERRRLSSESRGGVAIFIFSLLSVLGTASGMIAALGMAFLGAMVIAAIVYALKRYFLLGITFDERTVQSAFSWWWGYLLLAALTASLTGYGAYFATTPSKVEVERKSFNEPGWQESIQLLRSHIRKEGLRIEQLHDSDPRKAALKDWILDAGRTNLKIEMSLGDLSNEILGTEYVGQLSTPDGPNLAGISGTGNFDWRSAIGSLKRFVEHLERNATMISNTASMTPRWNGQLYEVRILLKNLESCLDEISGRVETFRGIKIFPSGLAPMGLDSTMEEHPSRTSVALEDNGGMTGAEVAKPLQVTATPADFMEFLRVAGSGDLRAIFFLSLAAILEGFVYNSVKRRERQAQFYWGRSQR